jgi:hypothetical protein
MCLKGNHDTHVAIRVSVNKSRFSNLLVRILFKEAVLTAGEFESAGQNVAIFYFNAMAVV